MTNKHLTSFVVLFEKFFGYNKAKSMDELHQLIKHKIYNGSWDLFRNDWSDSLELYAKLTDGIKTFEDAFERMVVTLKGNNLDENQTTDFLDLTLEMYLVTSKSKGVLDNEINEDYSFNRDHPNYNKFKVFSYLEKSFGLIVADFLSSKRPLQAEQMIEGQIKFRFNNIIDEYNKNETVADMYYDALKAHENQVINVSTKSDSTDIFDSIQEICKNKEGEVFNKIKHIFRDCHDYYVEEENIGGEKVVRSGKIIFLDKKDTKEHSFSISDIYEDYDDDDFLHEVQELKTTKPTPPSGKMIKGKLNCTFSYNPKSIFLYTCDKEDDLHNYDSHEFISESDLNACGTNEFFLEKDGETLLEINISLGHPEEEDMDFSLYEGKFLIVECLAFAKQYLDCNYDSEEDGEPTSVYSGLANSFNGLKFGEDEELKDYDNADFEEPEKYYQFYKVENGKAAPYDG